MHLKSLSIWNRTTDQCPAYWVTAGIMFLLEKHATFVMEKHQSPWNAHTHTKWKEKKKNFQKIQNIIDQIVETVMIQSSPKYIYCLFIQLHTCPFLIWTSVIIQSCFVWLHLFVWTSWQALRPVFRVKCSLGFEA